LRPYARAVVSRGDLAARAAGLAVPPLQDDHATAPGSNPGSTLGAKC